MPRARGRQFALYKIAGASGFGFDVQANPLSASSRRVAVPLLPVTQATPDIPRLTPIIDIDGPAHVLATHLITSVPLREIGEPVGDMADYQSEIATAPDVLLEGFP